MRVTISATAPAPDPELARVATELYREHHDFVWRNARRLGCSADWIDDAVHEVFLVATRRLSEFEGRAHPRTWLFAITFRVVQRQRRDRARQRASLERYAREQVPAVAHRDEDSAQYLRHLLLHLPVAQRLVLILAELEGFTTTEIASTLGIPAGTVHSRLRAAKLHLTRQIESEREQSERWKP